MADQVAQRGPLDGYESAFTALSKAGLRVAVVAQPTQINLRGQASDLTSAVAEACGGLALASAVNEVTTRGAWHCLGLGPDEWFLVGPTGMGAEISARLAHSLSAHHASVVDVSSNRVVLDIGGSTSKTLFAALTSFDIEDLKHDGCAQTMLAKTQVSLQALDNGAKMRVYVRSSFASYLADVILDTATFLPRD
jgi:sarcosine oxidase, subunit gamma